MPRGDAVKACQQSVVNIQRLCRLVDRLERDQVLANFHRTDHPENLRILSDSVFEVLDV
jgi:hypothetical protein